MPVFSVRIVLPVVTSVVATLFLATALPHDVAPEPAFEVALPDLSARVEVRHCLASGRDADDCLDEAAGKAVIERAEWLARNDDPTASRRASR